MKNLTKNERKVIGHMLMDFGTFIVTALAIFVVSFHGWETIVPDMQAFMRTSSGIAMVYTTSAAALVFVVKAYFGYYDTNKE